MKRLAMLGVSALALVLGAGLAPGSLLYWDANGSSSGTGGSGTWDTGNKWRLNTTGGTLTAWTEIAGGHDVIFQSTGGTVQISNSFSSIRTVSSMTFNSSGYALESNSSSSSRTLNLSGNFTLAVSGTGSVTIGDSSNDILVDIGSGVRTFDVSDSDTAYFVNRIQGTGGGGITKTGNGTLVFSGSSSFANTYTGLTQVNGGTLTLDKDNGVTAVAGNLTIGDGSGTDMVLLDSDNQIVDSAILTVNSGGVFRMNERDETVGGLVGAGIVENYVNNSSSDSLLTVNTAATHEFSGTLRDGRSGDLGFTKSGAGTQILSGTNTYSNATTVSGGKLLVNGSHTGGAAYTVGTNSTLGGSGSIGSSVSLSGSASQKAILNPGGNAAGDTAATLSITGNVSFNSNSRLVIDIDGATADRLSITGNFTLGTSTSDDLVFNTLVAPTAGHYTILSYTGSRTDPGTQGFTNPSGVPTGYRLSYANCDASDGMIELIQRAVIAPTADPIYDIVISGGSTAIDTLVMNAAQSGGDRLTAFTASGSGAGMSGSFGGGPLDPQTSTSNSAAIAFNSSGQPIGVNNRSVSVSSTDTDVVTPVPANFAVTVLAHSDATFANTSGGHQSAVIGDGGNQLDVDFGTVLLDANGGQIDSFFDVFAAIVSAGYTAGLDLDLLSGSGDTGTLALSGLSSFINHEAELAENYSLAFDTSTLGAFDATYTFELSDQDLPGATAPGSEQLTLHVIGTVVPEPATLILLGLGGLMAAWRRR